MSPQLFLILKYILAGLFFFFGAWLIFTVIKGRNREFRVQVSKSQETKKMAYNRSKGILIIIIILVLLVLWWMDK